MKHARWSIVCGTWLGKDVTTYMQQYSELEGPWATAQCHIEWCSRGCASQRLFVTIGDVELATQGCRASRVHLALSCGKRTIVVSAAYPTAYSPPGGCSTQQTVRYLGLRSTEYDPANHTAASSSVWSQRGHSPGHGRSFLDVDRACSRKL